MTETNAAAVEDDAPDIFELFESDPAAEKEGVKLTIGKSWFRIRSSDSPHMRSVRTRQYMAQAKVAQANRGSLPADIVEKNDIALACAAVTEWGDVPHPGDEQRQRGEMLPYNAANAQMLFSLPRLRALREWVLAQSQTFENFRAQAAATLEGNSASASAGSSSTDGTQSA